MPRAGLPWFIGSSRLARVDGAPIRRGLGAALLVTLALWGCGRGAVSETPVSDTTAEKASPTAEKVSPTAEATPDGAGAGSSPSGLASTVQQEIDAARRGAEPPPVPPGAELLAVVGGMPIPRSAFDEVYRLKVKKYADRGRMIPTTADRRYRKSITERLIHHERLRQHVATLGEDVDPAAIEARIDEQRRGIKDWTRHLERRGETEASIRAMIQAELREQLILEREGALVVSRAEIEKDYESIKSNWTSSEPRLRASHILIAVAEAGPGDDPAMLEAAALAKAEWVHAKAIEPGADFEALAREHSTGPSSRKGGDLGIFAEDRMAEEFSRAAFALKVGQISKPVKTKFGFHIIELTGKWPPGPLPIEALEDQIEERLQQRALHQGRRALKERLERELPATHHLLTPEELAPRSRQRPEERAGEPPPTTLEEIERALEAQDLEPQE